MVGCLGRYQRARARRMPTAVIGHAIRHCRPVVGIVRGDNPGENRTDRAPHGLRDVTRRGAVHVIERPLNALLEPNQVCVNAPLISWWEFASAGATEPAAAASGALPSNH